MGKKLTVRDNADWGILHYERVIYGKGTYTEPSIEDIQKDKNAPLPPSSGEFFADGDQLVIYEPESNYKKRLNRGESVTTSLGVTILVL
jgi:hypothetical protein